MAVEEGHDYQASAIQSGPQPRNKSQVWLSRTEETQEKNGAPRRNRTYNLWIKSPLLYQLS